MTARAWGRGLRHTGTNPAVQVVMARVEHMCAWADQTEAQRLLIGPGYSTAEARKEVAAIAKIGGDA